MPLREACKIPLPYLMLILSIALVFALYPQLDILISSMVFDEQTRRFVFSLSPVVNAVNFVINGITILFVLAVAGLAGVAWWLRKPGFSVARRAGAYLIVLFLVGPVLLVSFGFKDHWGRARPIQIEQFGGEKQFTPYYQPANQCESDCSFMSGHTSRGFYFISLYFLAVGAGLTGYRQRALLAATVTYGSFVALMRLFEGKHFASDVITSTILVTYLAWALYRWMQPVQGEIRIE